MNQFARIWAISSLVAWIVLLAAAIGSTSNVHAATTGDLEQRRASPQTSIDEVSRSVMCPSCDSTLDQSKSPAADRMRIWIAAAVESGWTKQEIRDGLVAEYDGDESILAIPRAQGLGLGVWIFPAIVIGGALLIGGFSLRRWRRAGASTPKD